MLIHTHPRQVSFDEGCDKLSSYAFSMLPYIIVLSYLLSDIQDYSASRNASRQIYI